MGRGKLVSVYQLRTGGRTLPYLFSKYSVASAVAKEMVRTKQARRVVVVQRGTGKELSPL